MSGQDHGRDIGITGERPDFRHVRVWVFDLDNTLYPAATNLFTRIDQRMGAFIARTLDVDLDEARRLQKAYYHTHGTTLRGLMDRHDIAPEDFLDYVHDIELDGLEHDRALAAHLAALPGRRFIYTNGSCAHAERVAAARGLTGLFEGIFDIAAAGYEPKPAAEPLARFLADIGAEPQTAAMFEDIARNLEAPHAAGMTTVLVEADSHPDKGHVYEPGADLPHVHHITDDLTAFLAVIDVG